MLEHSDTNIRSAGDEFSLVTQVMTIDKFILFYKQANFGHFEHHSLKYNFPVVLSSS